MPADAFAALAARVRRGPPPPITRKCAVFLDIDGTLLEIAPTPESVRADRALPGCSPALADHLGGALALVTGRSITDTDRLMGELVLPVAGQHGSERRDANGTLHLHAPDRKTLDKLRELVTSLASRHQGLRLEDKGATLALHYREVPQLASHVHQTLRAAWRRPAIEGFRLQPGKRLLEVRPDGRDKGTAIRDFLREAPFAGRCPVFVGDDRTDEHGFAVVRERKGIAVKVGPGSLRRQLSAGRRRAVRAWIEAALAE